MTKRTFPIHGGELEDALAPLVGALQQHFGTRVRYVPAMPGNFYLKNRNFELYLRYNDQWGNFVISTIEVKPASRRRKGIGTAIVGILTTFAKSAGFKQLVIESALTEGSVALAKKCGFQPASILPHNWNLDLKEPERAVEDEEEWPLYVTDDDGVSVPSFLFRKPTK